jgi:HEAT repeat protein
MRSPLWLLPLLFAACSGPEADIKSQDPYERFLGERELADRTDAEAIGQLVKLLDDPHYLVVLGAVEVLAGHERPEFLQHFVPKLKHKHPMVRQSAAESIGRIRSEEGVPAVIELLKDPEPAVRRSALKTLARFPKRPDALRATVEAVGDKEPSVSYMAHKLLSERTGRTDVKQTKEAWTEAVK